MRTHYNNNSRQTFEIILYNNEAIGEPTLTGDNEIKIQYYDFNNTSSGSYPVAGTPTHGCYSTVGIESLDQNHGYQYQFRNMTNGTQPVQNGLAILFTTNSSETFLQNGLVGIPHSLGLAQNYPNPFNPLTNISFKLERPGVVSLLVFDLSGSMVNELKRDVYYTSGIHMVEFDGRDLSSGIYFYQLQADGVASTRKMALLK